MEPSLSERADFASACVYYCCDDNNQQICTGLVFFADKIYTSVVKLYNRKSKLGSYE